MFTHNTAGVLIIVACTKDGLLMTIPIFSSPEHLGRAVWRREMEIKGANRWDHEILRMICLKYDANLSYTTPQPTTLNDLRQYALHVQGGSEMLVPDPRRGGGVSRNGLKKFGEFDAQDGPSIREGGGGGARDIIDSMLPYYTCPSLQQHTSAIRPISIVAAVVHYSKFVVVRLLGVTSGHCCVVMLHDAGRRWEWGWYTEVGSCMTRCD
ncbi:hypothetical protein EI94DRAFT_1888274 [Lactarius quietus]|nr:hypothetical protein EI94DRAFT_1888274 [Lactarius quietus]